MGNSNNDKTKRIKTSDLKKKMKSKGKNNSRPKNEKNKFKNRHPKISLAIKIILIILVLCMIIGAGILVGVFYGFFGDELKIDMATLKVGYENSTVYDADGELIATLSGGTKRKSISLSEMSEYLPKAYVAIEDERFYNHSGIDIGRTGYATVNYLIHKGNSNFGGSTITQQVIKNITQDKERTALAGVMRKVKEISKAIQVEHYLSKDQILELYLNLIFVGGDDVNGVELGSIYYFDKSAKDLSIAECAYMAGINNSPNAYKPFADFADKENPEEEKQKMAEKIKTRTKTVLGKMKQLAYISDDQYNEAVAEVDNGLAFKKGESASVTTDVSYHTEAAISQILEQIMKDNPDMNRDMAEMTLYSSGYKIYTTQKTSIQKILEEEIVKDTWFTSSKYTDKDKETGEKVQVTQYSTPTMVIEDQTTGQVVAAATATGSKEERTAITKLGYLNFATDIKKQTGSSMKPISVIAPGLETGVITGATVYYNLNSTWGANSAKPWNPKNSTGYSTYSNMRTAIELSYNIPHAKALTNIGTEAAVEFCKKVGLPDFTEEGLSLALGGLHDGVSPAQMVAAYSAIANDGLYITPTFYTKVTDSEGNTIYEPSQEETRAMTEQNAFIEKDILTQPVVGTRGTAKYCAIPGIETAAKTGTTNDDFDRWLSGFTPYYTATCWYGYEHNAEVHYSGNPAGKLWATVMKAVHKDLPNAEFAEPEGIIRKQVCSISGKLATASCGENVYTELFTESSVPTETCEGHGGSVRICADSGLLALNTCPNVSEVYGYVPEKEKDAPWVTKGAASSVPTDFCNIHVGSGVSPYEQAAWQAATDAAAAQASGDAAAAAEAQARFEEANRKLQESKGIPQPQVQQPAQTQTQTQQTQQQTQQQAQKTTETPSTQTTETPQGQTGSGDGGNGAEAQAQPPAQEQAGGASDGQTPGT